MLHEQPLYLIDYGLANRFHRDGFQHQKNIQKSDAKHNRTILYTSRDAHDGVCKYSLLNALNFKVFES